jgi:hypothetical protein
METKGKRGRWTKRSPEVEAGILQALRDGCTQKDACESNGVTWETMNRWRLDDPEFRLAVSRAEAEVARAMAARLRVEATKADGDWRAAESWLKRRRREDWSERQEITGAAGGGLEIVVRFADEEPK